MIYLIPLENNLGSGSRLSTHFGRARYYAMLAYEDRTSTLKVEVKQSPNLIHGGTCGAADIVKRLGADAVIVKGIGLRAVQLLQSLGIKVYKTESETLDQVIKEVREGRLTPITESEACAGGRRYI